MTREQAMAHMQQGGKVKHKQIHQRAVHLVGGHVREVRSGFGLHSMFMTHEAMAKGWTKAD